VNATDCGAYEKSVGFPFKFPAATPGVEPNSDSLFRLGKVGELYGTSEERLVTKAGARDCAAWAQTGAFRVPLWSFLPPGASRGLRRAYYAPCGASRWLILASRLRC
jgi:hypothetical protein